MILLSTQASPEGTDGDLRKAVWQPAGLGRVGGGALTRWPPSASQTARAVFPHAAFTKIQTSEMPVKESTEPG